jgi:hypothetical protein
VWSQVKRIHIAMPLVAIRGFNIENDKKSFCHFLLKSNSWHRFMSYFDRLPKELLGLIFSRCNSSQIDAIFQCSPIMIERYDTNKNNDLWVQKMTENSSKVITCRDQVLQQERQDAISMREYRNVLQQTIIHRKIDYIPDENDKFDLVYNGFLKRHPALLDRLLNQILVNFNYHITNSLRMKGHLLLMDGDYTMLKLAIIFNRVDMLEALYVYANQTNLWYVMGIYGRSHITTIFEYHQFSLLPYFESYQEKWVEDLLESTEEGSIGYHWIVKHEISQANMQLLIAYLNKCIQIVDEKYLEHSVGSFLTQFYYEYCSMRNECSCHKSFEPLISFLYQHLSNYHKDEITEFYHLDYLMNFDSLVSLILKTDKYMHAYMTIIANTTCYSDKMIADRVHFCLNISNFSDIELINKIVCKAIFENNLAALRVLIDRFAIKQIELVRMIDSYTISFEVLQLIVLEDIHIINPYSISSFRLDNFEQIERYLDLFRILETKGDTTSKKQLIQKKHLETFVRQWTIFVVDHPNVINGYHQILSDLFV